MLLFFEIASDISGYDNQMNCAWKENMIKQDNIITEYSKTMETQIFII